MGFFKDFKDDFSQAVNELMPGEDNLEDGAANEDLVVNSRWNKNRTAGNPGKSCKKHSGGKKNGRQYNTSCQ